MDRLAKLYHYAHYLKLSNLCKSVAAYIGAKVYFKDCDELEAVKKEYKVKEELTVDAMKKLKGQFSFLNHVD